MLSHVRAGMQKYKLKIKDVLCAPRKSAIMELLLMEAFWGDWKMARWRIDDAHKSRSVFRQRADHEKKTILMF